MKKNTKKQDIVASFNSALEGLLCALRRERNLKIHILFAVVIIFLGLFLKLPLPEFVLLLIVIAIVLIAELMNTAIEIVIDVCVTEYHPIAKKAKDVSASAVLISTLLSVIAGYLIFTKNFPSGWRNIFINIAKSSGHLSFLALVLVMSLSLLMKLLIGRKFSISGGMPSIHSVVSFSIWTAISFLTFTEFPVISLLVFILAFWVAQSRVLRGIHKPFEVLIGGIIGIFLTTLLFQLFWRW
ncbi:MAG: phosphatase PAP2 family protein [Elusimicrobia bacterium]|jgi:diacylglycerol kinase (ATP)|nr:phosphatase PAP2 family protein [Elusimicrobiota bacterium]